MSLLSSQLVGDCRIRRGTWYANVQPRETSFWRTRVCYLASKIPNFCQSLYVDSKRVWAFSATTCFLHEVLRRNVRRLAIVHSLTDAFPWLCGQGRLVGLQDPLANDGAITVLLRARVYRMRSRTRIMPSIVQSPLDDSPGKVQMMTSKDA
jgi:hypothetical protein